MGHDPGHDPELLSSHSSATLDIQAESEYDTTRPEPTNSEHTDATTGTTKVNDIPTKSVPDSSEDGHGTVSYSDNRASLDAKVDSGDKATTIESTLDASVGIGVQQPSTTIIATQNDPDLEAAMGFSDTGRDLGARAPKLEDRHDVDVDESQGANAEVIANVDTSPDTEITHSTLDREGCEETSHEVEPSSAIIDTKDDVTAVAATTQGHLDRQLSGSEGDPLLEPGAHMIWQLLRDKTGNLDERLETLGSRVQYLYENLVLAEEHSESSDESDDEDMAQGVTERLRPISSLNQLTIEEYKKRRFTYDRPHYCIDAVRSGSAITSTKSADVGSSETEDTKVPHDNDEGEPFRCIQINSQALLSGMSTSDHNYSLIIFSPFKSLICEETKYRKRLSDLASKWAHTGAQDQPSTPIAPPATDNDTSLHATLEGEDPALDATLTTQKTTPEPTQVGSSPRSNPIESDGPAVGAKSVAEREDNTPSDPKDGKKDLVVPGKSIMTENDKLGDSRQAYNDLKCLLQFYDDFVLPRWTFLRGVNAKRVRFGDLWALFQPGDHVHMPGNPQKVWRVLKVTGGRPFSEHLLSDEYGRRGTVQPVAGQNVEQTEDGESAEDQDASATSKGNSKSSTDRTKWSPFVIDGYYLDFNGGEFGPVPLQCTFNYFGGVREITSLVSKRKDVKSLTTYPLRFADETKKAEYVKHGRRFLELSRTKLCYYGGRSLPTGADGSALVKNVDHMKHVPWYNGSQHVRSEDVSSQVMIDAEKAFKDNPTWAPTFGLTKFAKANRSEDNSDPLGDLLGTFDDWSLQYIDYFDKSLTEKYRMKDEWVQNVSDSTTDNRDRCREDEFIILLPDRVFGFVLRTRTWACFDMRETYLRNINLDQSGWDELQLPRGHKTTLEALVERHVRDGARKGAFSQQNHEMMDFDFVQGKGKGLVVLLHGLPGVGKTSTAETIAQKYGKPLMPITCGNLGLEPAGVEVALTEYFALAQAWDCIVLLDEADVFLAARSATDLQRNALVSVFLRTLDYYTGILFLTTNRPGTFDEAFGSRIHIALYYPALSRPATESIWKSSLVRLGKNYKKTGRTLEVGNDGEEIVRFARALYDTRPLTGRSYWNGRQIRNAFQSAISLAEFDKPQGSVSTLLKWEHFRTVALAVDEFETYLQDSRGGFSDIELASQAGLRAQYSGEDRLPAGFDDAAASQNTHEPVPISRSQQVIESLTPNSIISDHSSYAVPNPFSTPQPGVRRQSTFNQRLNMTMQPGFSTVIPHNPIEPVLNQGGPHSGMSPNYGTGAKTLFGTPQNMTYQDQGTIGPQLPPRGSMDGSIYGGKSNYNQYGSLQQEDRQIHGSIHSSVATTQYTGKQHSGPYEAAPLEDTYSGQLFGDPSFARGSTQHQYGHPQGQASVSHMYGTVPPSRLEQNFPGTTMSPQ